MKTIRVIHTPRFLLLLVIVFLSVSGCKKASKGISIGVILPQTGVLAEPGRNVLEGIELAAQKYNASCENPNHRIKLIVEDSKSNSRDGVSALNKLIHQDKVKIVIGDLSSEIFLAGAPIAEQNQVVMISPGASNPSVREAGDYIFRDYVSDEFDGKIMADYLFSRMGKKKAALVYVNGDYGLGVSKTFEDEYTRLGGTVVYKDSFLAGTTDFKTMVIKVKDSNPEVIYLVGNPAENGYFVKQMKAYRVNVPITGNLAFENNDFITVAKGSFDSIVYSTAAFDVDNDSPEVRSFVDDYQKQYQRTPDMAAGLGYDVMNILLYCLGQTGFNTDLVKDTLYKVSGFVGVTGITTFDQYGDVMKDIYIKRIDGDGTVSFVESFIFSE